MVVSRKIIWGQAPRRKHLCRARSPNGLIAKKGFDSRIDIDNEFAVEALIFLAFALFAVKPLLNRFFLLFF
jgi:hypothetical protein